MREPGLFAYLRHFSRKKNSLTRFPEHCVRLTGTFSEEGIYRKGNYFLLWKMKPMKFSSNWAARTCVLWLGS